MFLIALHYGLYLEGCLCFGVLKKRNSDVFLPIFGVFCFMSLYHPWDGLNLVRIYLVSPWQMYQ
ncbi:MAG: hypothetical protein Ct9H90mP25_5870 [Gammaproteobacteria bacterium]|nr:MAG: hypothetical protein Ct9H90mP25_5870 [Gammaproteobacteria bacterium]